MQSKTYQMDFLYPSLALVTIAIIWAASGSADWWKPSLTAMIGFGAIAVVVILLQRVKSKNDFAIGVGGVIKPLATVDNGSSVAPVITIGSSYRDRITGFEGIAVGFVKYISGCNQVLISPQVGEDGSLRDSHWFDVQRMVDTGAGMVVLDNGNTPGFDRAAPKK